MASIRDGGPRRGNRGSDQGRNLGDRLEFEVAPWPIVDGVTCDPKGGIVAVARREGLVDVFVADTSGAVNWRQRIERQWSPAWERLAGGGLHAQYFPAGVDLALTDVALSTESRSPPAAEE